MPVSTNPNVLMKLKSPLANSIVDSVSAFIKANAEVAAISKGTFTTQDGADALAAAICYAIGKALSSPLLNAGWALTMPPVPPAVGIMGPAIQGVTFEP